MKNEYIVLTKKDTVTLENAINELGKHGWCLESHTSEVIPELVKGMPGDLSIRSNYIHHTVIMRRELQ